MSNHPMDKEETDECCKNSIIKPACLPITILAILLLMTFFIPLFNDDTAESTKKYERTGLCHEGCTFEIVESIPTGGFLECTYCAKSFNGFLLNEKYGLVQFRDEFSGF